MWTDPYLEQISNIKCNRDIQGKNTCIHIPELLYSVVWGEVNELNRKPVNIPQIINMAPLVTPCSMGAVHTEAQKVPGFKAIQMSPGLS